MVNTYGYTIIESTGSAIELESNPQIADGTNGQIMYLMGNSDTNTVTVVDGNGLKLQGGTSFTLGDGDIIQLIYNATKDLWIEISRSDN